MQWLEHGGPKLAYVTLMTLRSLIIMIKDVAYHNNQRPQRQNLLSSYFVNLIVFTSTLSVTLIK